MFYINAAATLSHQQTFLNPGFSGIMQPLTGEEEVQSVTYKNYIDANILRRMSRILRMGVACAKESLRTVHDSDAYLQPEAIVVGTGLGCLMDTEKFLDTALTVEGMLPPTSFIQSTHNTIAGQISLSLGNHAYNMTHTQNFVSFEHAMLDGILCLEEGSGDVLVGGADERIMLLDMVAENFGFPEVPLASGVSFFRLSSSPDEHSLACVLDVEVITGGKDPKENLIRFLSDNNCTLDEIDKIIYQAPIGIDIVPEILGNEYKGIAINSIPFSGLYSTASAFALHMAVDEMNNSKKSFKILIFNQLNPNSLGFILLKSVEA